MRVQIRWQEPFCLYTYHGKCVRANHFTDGITRQLFVDLALTVAFTLMASLVVALTFVPAIASGMLKRRRI